VWFSPDGRFIVDSSWRGDFLVRDSVSGETAWTSDVSAYGVTPRRDRAEWAFFTADGVALQRWPFWDHSLVTYAPPPGAPPDAKPPVISEIVLADESDRVVVALGGAVEMWLLDSASRQCVRTARWETAISGTGDAVAWHPSGQFVAYAGAGVASILTHDSYPYGTRRSRTRATWSSQPTDRSSPWATGARAPSSRSTCSRSRCRVAASEDGTRNRDTPPALVGSLPAFRAARSIGSLFTSAGTVKLTVPADVQARDPTAVSGGSESRSGDGSRPLTPVIIERS